ncbi:MAG: prpC-A [Chlamydiales bacterium]|jgi:protein phosphatase|nr:prpC-A [Chlamydiales bacterium]
MAVHLLSYKLVSFGDSDIGLVRKTNEDVWAELPHLSFYALADGMGGHRAGEVAAKEAIDRLCKSILAFYQDEQVEKESIEHIAQGMVHAISEANRHVYEMSSSQKNLRGMGTTLCCLKFHHHQVIYAHVGDSRIYRYRAGELKRLTRDHSLVSELLEIGNLTKAEAEGATYKNIITRAIGTEAKVKVSFGLDEVLGGDVFMMCSDGLSDMLSDDEIAQVIANTPTVNLAVTGLIEASKAKGGFDNVTIVMIEVRLDNAPG